MLRCSLIVFYSHTQQNCTSKLHHHTRKTSYTLMYKQDRLFVKESDEKKKLKKAGFFP